MTKKGIELLTKAAEKAREGSGTLNQAAAVVLGVMNSLEEKDARRDLLGDVRADMIKLSLDLAMTGGAIEATATNIIADE